ncbi:MAG: HupE/UreJ family protein [Gloeomargaritaceae cyanobacterium C42_A2020_066]|nr:HupE/UreJ family protein [Gloeomargaritaceae cyanobacterium C42_A2020_066]
MLGKSMRPMLWFLGSLALALLAMPANAHVGVGETAGFWHGFTHPIGGLDHILAMVAVGLWAAQLGGRAIWVVPTSFVAVMILGGVLGLLGVPLPGVEPGIIASDFILGALVLLATRIPLVPSAALVGVLALFHGYAHGAEMPENAKAISYAVGFVVATAGLHGVGIGLAIALKQMLSDRMVRLAGAGILLGGVYVLVNALAGA